MIIAALVVGWWWWDRRSVTQELESIKEGLKVEEMAEELASELGVSLPDGAEKAELKDIAGDGARGVATKSEENGGWLITVLAALDDVDQGWYEGWLMNEETGELMGMGRLRIAKGGYLGEYTGMGDYDRVMVTLEMVEDGVPEEVVLEGVLGE